jgi:hypothetical protein
MSTVPFFHWYKRGDVPFATTEKVTDPPAVTVWDCGCVTIEGAVGAGFTAKDRLNAELVPPPFVAVSVTVELPAVVGVPVIAPVVVLRLNPAGSVPEATA